MPEGDYSPGPDVHPVLPLPEDRAVQHRGRRGGACQHTWNMFQLLLISDLSIRAGALLADRSAKEQIKKCIYFYIFLYA